MRWNTSVHGILPNDVGRISSPSLGSPSLGLGGCGQNAQTALQALPTNTVTQRFALHAAQPGDGVPPQCADSPPLSYTRLSILRWRSRMSISCSVMGSDVSRSRGVNIGSRRGEA